MGHLLRLALAGLLAAGTVLLTPSTAHACSCVAAGEERYARWAEAVLVGTVVGRDGASWWQAATDGGGSVSYEVAVDRVLKGAVGTTAVLRSRSSEASCGIDLEVGVAYLLFAHRDRDGGLAVGLCQGTTRATPAAVDGAERLLGPPHAPAGASRVPTDPATDTATDAGVWPFGVGGTVAAGVLAGAALLTGRRRRGRPASD